MDTEIPQVSVASKFFENSIVSYGLKILWAIVVILFLLMLSKFIAGVIRRNIIKNADPDNKHIDKIGKLIHDISFYILVIFSVFIGFEMVGFNVWVIVWGISFWVWLAFKNILGNMVAGIMILYTKEFKLGDLVEIRADEKYFGRIEEITIRYTIIRTLELRQVVIPNLTMISIPVKTFSAEPLIKLIVPFRGTYDGDSVKAIEVMKEAVNSVEFVKNKENTKVFLSEFLDSCIEYKARFEWDPNTELIEEIAIGQVTQAIAIAFDKNGIDVPYDILTVNFESPEEKANVQEQINT